MTCPASQHSPTNSTSPSTASPRSIMDPLWNREATWSGPESAERRGRQMDTLTLTFPRDQNTSSMITHLSAPEIEEEILRDPELHENSVAVLLYLRLDIWLLESIFALRNSGSGELARLHPTLFASPPDSLFNLIYTLRHFIGPNLAGIISRIEAATYPGRSSGTSREPPGKIAPPGQAYACPSKWCKKVFVKSGHAVNHVEKQHPEYLKLHPDYQPSHFMVEHVRSRPTSPELERQRSNTKQAELRPSTVAPTTPSVASEGLSIYFSDAAGGVWERPSPRLQGYESQGDSDEAPRLIPSRNPSRNTSRPSPLHPSTPQEPYGQLHPDVSRYHMLSSHSKRGREHSSSVESISTVDEDEEGGTTRFRHHAKRRALLGHF